MNATCDNCGTTYFTTPSEYKRKKRHFHNRDCYTEYREKHLPTEEQNAWQGGVTVEESRRRWAAKNKKAVDARKQARRLRELNAPGSHTKKEWEELKAEYGNECAEHDDTCKGSITKDHKVPLIMGGSNDITNLQPLCRSHNSRKSRKVYTGTFG